MDVQVPPAGRPAIDQATGAVLVLRIVFDHLTIGEDLANLRDADSAGNGLVYRVF
jgi:hypothetical protein